MIDGVMSCIGRNCLKGELLHYATQEEAKRAQCRDKELSKLLKEHYKDDLKRLKLLLLGTGESGKSTITKQMRIIHINGFDTQERIAKITDIRRNIKESIVMILLAMQQLGISLEHAENQEEMDFILKKAGDEDVHNTKEFMEYTARLWEDGGVQECYSRSHEYQLLDSAKYFLDRIGDIRQTDYIPTDQDILRCRMTTTSIQHIEFDVPDAGQQVKFSVYDVGGQRGERKKWIQVFDSVVAILFLADCSSFDQNLREDSSKNRLLEALEIFEQVWKNRFLRNVSILLFINKIDILSEKVCRGRSIRELVEKYPDIFPDYDTFNPSNTEKLEFLDSFLKRDGDSKRRRGSRSGSRPDVNPEIIKTAVYIKHLFIGAALGAMVGFLTYGNKKFYELDGKMRQLIPPLYKAMKDLVPFIDADAAAFSEYLLAMKLPNATEEEKAVREKAMQDGLCTAIQVPQTVSKIANSMWPYLIDLAAVGNINCKSDLQVGAKTLETAVWGTYFNVKTNLSNIKDEEFRSRVAREMEDAIKTAQDGCAEILKILEERKA